MTVQRPVRHWLLAAGSLGAAVAAFAVCHNSNTPSAHATMEHRHFHDAQPVQVTGIGPWVPYDEGRASLRCVFEYPQNWVAGQETGREDPYWQALIIGPRNAEDSQSAGLMVRRLPQKAEGGRYANLEELRAARRRSAATSPSYQSLMEGTRMVGSVLADYTDYTYVVMLPPNSLNAKPTPLRRRLVHAASGDSLYELSFTADAREFAAYERVFEHLLDSVRFLPDEPAAP